MRPTWAEISLQRLQQNYRAVRERAGKAVEVCAVVKCDAYGHGAVECARALAQDGVRWFAVHSPEEGIELREAGIAERILLLGSFYRDQAEDVIRHDLTPDIWEYEHIDYLSRALRGRKDFPVHVEIDTGMARQGVPAEHAAELLQQVRKAGLQVEGVFQHYAAGECFGNGSAFQQEARFAQVLSQVRNAGFSPKYIHMANSGSAIGRAPIFADAQFAINGARSMIRSGIALYGYYLPLENNSENIANWNTGPVLSWKTRVISLREVEAGTGIGYSGAYTTERRTRIASIPLGYGDGLNRLLSSRGRVLVRGQYAPMIGNVSMDMTLIDVTDLDGVELGDEVVILGTQGDLGIDAWEHATLCDTIPYEILCDIGARVHRKYLE